MGRRLSYLAYTEQITFLLFLKMADDLQSALDHFAAIATDLKTSSNIVP